VAQTLRREDHAPRQARENAGDQLAANADKDGNASPENRGSPHPCRKRRISGIQFESAWPKKRFSEREKKDRAQAGTRRSSRNTWRCGRAAQLGRGVRARGWRYGWLMTPAERQRPKSPRLAHITTRQLRRSISGQRSRSGATRRSCRSPGRIVAHRQARSRPTTNADDFWSRRPYERSPCRRRHCEQHGRSTVATPRTGLKPLVNSAPG